MRYAGQAFELPVPAPTDPDPADLVERFERAHEERYGHRDPDGEVVLVDIRLAMVAPGPGPGPRRPPRAADARASRQVRFGGEWVETPVLRGEPAAGPAAEGPAIFELPEATFVVPPGWSSRGRRRRDDLAPGGARAMSAMDPITLQVLVGGLRAACEEMGAALIRSAYSANIKERHDCSTALFDAARRAGDAGRAHPRPPRLDARRGRRRARAWSSAPGEAWILNDPYRGGTHLPDITLISPVFVARRAARLRRLPRPPRRRRRADPRQHAGRLDDRWRKRGS